MGLKELLRTNYLKALRNRIKHSWATVDPQRLLPSHARPVLPDPVIPGHRQTGQASSAFRNSIVAPIAIHRYKFILYIERLYHKRGLDWIGTKSTGTGDREPVCLQCDCLQVHLQLGGTPFAVGYGSVWASIHLTYGRMTAERKQITEKH